MDENEPGELDLTLEPSDEEAEKVADIIHLWKGEKDERDTLTQSLPQEVNKIRKWMRNTNETQHVSEDEISKIVFNKGEDTTWKVETIDYENDPESYDLAKKEVLRIRRNSDFDIIDISFFYNYDPSENEEVADFGSDPLAYDVQITVHDLGYDDGVDDFFTFGKTPISETSLDKLLVADYFLREFQAMVIKNTY